ncbi:hypothetical protein HP570_03275 [Brevibacillus sp. RS1.1]|uniref:hypothetical protein n=1 Tax=Brevibacillus sp. RS1.1 TaxID=2738982 RepID=UPI00156AF878|nr:hypothetical protein [Brevibacillus sp. RS1.1]
MYFTECKTEKISFKSLKNTIGFITMDGFRKKLNQCAPVEYRNTLVTYAFLFCLLNRDKTRGLVF